jgi:NADH-quinone oxidoreductase subunit E
MLRRLAAHQPDAFAFTPANRAWAEAQVSKYPPGRQASAIIPLLWRAQEQEGWLSKPAIEHVADMLGMPYIRALEVATFYFMFQLHPVGSLAHVQVCGTTSCMICGAEDLVAVCREVIAPKPHQCSPDGRFSWEEVECLGACANAPMVQIGKDYYEDLTAERLRGILARFAAGEVPVPGPQNGRYAAEPVTGLTSLRAFEGGRAKGNASVQAAMDLGDTVRRIDGTEVALTTPWRGRPAEPAAPTPEAQPAPGAGRPADATGATVQEAPATSPGKPAADGAAPEATPAATPQAKAPVPPVRLAEARGGVPDDLQLIRGIGPRLEALCHRLGFFHFDQIAAWTADEVAWVDENLEGFHGRVTRDDWVGQAQMLAAAAAPAARREGDG